VRELVAREGSREDIREVEDADAQEGFAVHRLCPAIAVKAITTEDTEVTEVTEAFA
jgi:hypothetical protein